MPTINRLIAIRCYNILSDVMTKAWGMKINASGTITLPSKGETLRASYVRVHNFHYGREVTEEFIDEIIKVVNLIYYILDIDVRLKAIRDVENDVAQDLYGNQLIHTLIIYEQKQTNLIHKIKMLWYFYFSRKCKRIAVETLLHHWIWPQNEEKTIKESSPSLSQ